MVEYSVEQVKEYLRMYGNMVLIHENYPAGVSSEDTRKNIRKIIEEAKTIPKEIQPGGFDNYLKGLEKIVRGKSILT